MALEMLEEEEVEREEKPISKPEPAPKIQPLRRPRHITAIAIVGLFVLALFYTFYFARDFFLPLTLAWLLNLLLKPLVRGMKRIHITEAIGAGIVLMGIVALLFASLYFVSEPASAWLTKAPATLSKAGERVRGLSRPAQKIKRAATQVENIGSVEDEEPTQKVEIKRPGIMGSVLSKTTDVVFLLGETIVLLYFFLATGDLLMLKTIQILPTFSDKRKAIEIARETEQQVSRYLGAISVVNAIEGILVGIGLAIVGMPNPILWAVMAALVNFVPYIGAMVTLGCITVVSLVTFDSMGHALLAPGIYLAVNMSDNFIAPMFLGKRLVLNPLVVFIALMFWGWIWGIIGALLAVPITMAFKIFCDHFQSLAPIGELLTGEPAKTEA